MQFVETDLPNGGSGITFVPHDPLSSVPPCNVPPIAGVNCVRPAFLETNHSTAEVDLLRYWDDDNAGCMLGDAGCPQGTASSNHRPFIVKDAAFPLNTNFGGTDSRGIAIDPTPRLACEARPGTDKTVCADLPARVFIANRTPPSLVLGEVGGVAPSGLAYDPDLLTLSANISLPVTEQFTREDLRCERFTGPARPVHDQDRIGRRRIAHRVVMQLQLRQAFAVVKFEIVNRIVARNRRRKVRRGADKSEQKGPNDFGHRKIMSIFLPLSPAPAEQSNPRMSSA